MLNPGFAQITHVTSAGFVVSNACADMAIAREIARRREEEQELAFIPLSFRNVLRPCFRFLEKPLSLQRSAVTSGHCLLPCLPKYSQATQSTLPEDLLG